MAWLWVVLKIVLIVLAVLVGLVLLALLTALVLSLFRISVRFSNFRETLLTVRYGLIRLRILPKKPKKPKKAGEPAREPTEREKARAEKKKQRKAARRKRWRARFEKWQSRRAARRQRKKARQAARAAKTGRRPKRKKSEADWLSEPKKGRARALVESAFDVLPRALKLIRFDNVEYELTVRGETPAQTGIRYGRAAELFGICYPQAMERLRIGRHNVRVNADFASRGESDHRVDVTARLRPIRLFGLLVRFFFSFIKYKKLYGSREEQTRQTFKMKPNGGKNNG